MTIKKLFPHNILASGAIDFSQIMIKENSSCLITAKAVNGKTLPQVAGVAYSGGTIRQAWSNKPLIVDITGIKISNGQFPLLQNHHNSPEAKLGEIIASKADNKILINGVITANNANSKNIVSQAQNGANWELSIGARPLKGREIAEGEKITANGQTFTGPALLVTESELFEVSIVALGADNDTSVSITANLELNNNKNNQLNPNFGGNQTMKFTKKQKNFIIAKFSLDKNSSDEVIEAALGEHNLTLSEVDVLIKASENSQTTETDTSAGVTENSVKTNKNVTASALTQDLANLPNVTASKTTEIDIETISKDVVAAERQRIKAIKDACDGEYPTIEASAIAEGWDLNKVNGEILAAIRTNRGTSGNFHIQNGSVTDDVDIKAALEVNVLASSGLLNSEALVKDYGEVTVEASNKFGQLGLQGIYHILAAQADYHGIGFTDQTIRAANSTGHIPVILSNVANKMLQKAFEVQTGVARKLCKKGTLNDFKKATSVRLHKGSGFQKMADNGKIKHTNFDETSSSRELESYAQRLVLGRKMIINDDLDALKTLINSFGVDAAILEEELFFNKLLANNADVDNNKNFSAAHKNIATDLKWDAESMLQLINLFRSQKVKRGKLQVPVNNAMKTLLVPTEHVDTAKTLFTSTGIVIAGGGDNVTIPDGNKLAGHNIDIVGSSWLSDEVFPKYNNKDIFGFSNPDLMEGLKLDYLHGNDKPILMPSEVAHDELGLAWNVVFDVACNVTETRGIAKGTLV
ncbi:hypothetical protein AAEX28_07120 [Lentisphaerota bacterium WC36G]|nr:hypothetical protein LJT99_09985 [Lentisphaerae bacterium WC36]